MNIKAQVSMVFHLDKCIGCHTCSVACKNLWTDRKGAEYMWWNNVETKPGTGYPHRWEDQKDYKGGWLLKSGKLKLRGSGKIAAFKNIFSNPSLPMLEDYYEPWTYKYEDLTNSPELDDQPTARPISMITGEPIDIKSGPNWDDDLSGSEEFAKNDPNLDGMSAEEKENLFNLQRLVMMYLPRICNHCLNPSCLAACPSGAIYKRGEDGVVLINQDACRGWRMCVSACPYKKTFYNWNTGKSEKCILCYPRLEVGEVPACMHSCVGRIRYLGVLLYDADKIESLTHLPEDQLIDGQLDAILNPFDPEVIKKAKEALSAGKPARVLQLTDDEKPFLKGLQLLTSKPVLYVCNVNEEDFAKGGNEWVELVKKYAANEGNKATLISAAIEAEISTLSKEEQTEFLASLGVTEKGMDRLIHESYKLLELATYFTAGKKEVRAWTIKKGMKAPQAAGVIHTDFEKGFIRAETYHCEDLFKLKTEAAIKEAGLYRSEGKEYVVKDGDVMLFRFNV